MQQLLRSIHRSQSEYTRAATRLYSIDFLLFLPANGDCSRPAHGSFRYDFTRCSLCLQGPSGRKLFYTDMNVIRTRWLGSLLLLFFIPTQLMATRTVGIWLGAGDGHFTTYGVDASAWTADDRWFFSGGFYESSNGPTPRRMHSRGQNIGVEHYFIDTGFSLRANAAEDVQGVEISTLGGGLGLDLSALLDLPRYTTLDLDIADARYRSPSGGSTAVHRYEYGLALNHELTEHWWLDASYARYEYSESPDAILAGLIRLARISSSTISILLGVLDYRWSIGATRYFDSGLSVAASFTHAENKFGLLGDHTRIASLFVEQPLSQDLSAGLGINRLTGDSGPSSVSIDATFTYQF